MSRAATVVLLFVAACSDAGRLEPATQRVAWTRTIAGPAAEEALALAIDDRGEIWLAGTFEGRVEFEGATLTASASRDLFVAHLDADGGRLGFDAVNQRTADVAVLRGSAVRDVWWAGTFFGRRLAWPGADLVGDSGAEGFAVRTSGAIDAAAAATFGGPGQQFVSAVAVAPDGGAWVAGRFDGALFGPGGWTATSSGSTDIFLARLDRSGALRAQRTFGGLGSDGATALTRVSDGGAVVAALVTGPIDWASTRIEGPDAERFSLVSGLSMDGDVRWTTIIGPGAEVIALAPGLDGGVVAAGTMRRSIAIGSTRLDLIGGIDIFVLIFDADGQLFAGRRFGGNELDLVRGVAIDRTGAVWLTGTFQSDLQIGTTSLRTDGSRALYVARLAPDLTPRWAEQFGQDEGDQVAAALAVGPDGLAVLAAGFEIGIDVGPDSLMGAGGFDILIAKLRP